MDDLDLARDMIRLLGNEVKQLRQQCQNCRCKDRSTSSTDAGDRAELAERSRQLEEELRESRLRLQVALESEDVKRNPLFKSSRALQGQGEREHAAAFEALKNKWKASREKYKNAKESMNTLQSDLEESQLKCQRLKEKLRMTREQLPKPEFDAQQFIETLVVGDFQPKILDHFSAELRLSIPPEVLQTFTQNAIISSNIDEIIWSKHGQKHGVMIVPTYRYNAKAQRGQGSWQASGLLEDLVKNVGQKRELFYMHDRRWFYNGLYEYVGMTAMITRDVRHMGSTRVTDNAIKRTVLFPDLVPPITKTMVQNMYEEGVLKVSCLGLKCVGFNHNLYRALQEELGTRNKRATIIHVPQEGATDLNTKKRAHTAGGHRGQSKKAKTDAS